MRFAIRAVCCSIIVSGFSQCLVSAAVAQDESAAPVHDPAKVIAHQGEVVLTQLEIDAAFSKLPEEGRLRFIRDGAKVDQLIRALLRRKVVAAEAVKAGFDQDPLVAARMRLEAQKELVEAWLQKLTDEIPAADYEALAREDYLANPDRYRSDEVLDISHILIGTEARAGEEARALAAELERQLVEEPSRFDELIERYSDDPAKIDNGGRYREMRRGTMASEFEEAAFALAEAGAISEPVRTVYGWHIIRLNGRGGNERQEWSVVQEEAIARARSRHIATYRENYLRRVLAEPVEFPEGSVEIMAKRHFGENLELAPEAGR
jgi:peptidyl-prolyl cis-trans isomerase C